MRSGTAVVRKPWVVFQFIQKVFSEVEVRFRPNRFGPIHSCDVRRHCLGCSINTDIPSNCVLPTFYQHFGEGPNIGVRVRCPQRFGLMDKVWPQDNSQQLWKS